MAIVPVPAEIIESVVERLTNELRVYQSAVLKFEKKYTSSLEEFELKLEKEGVPVEHHELWEDSIEWRNAKEEIQKLEAILQRLEV